MNRRKWLLIFLSVFLLASLLCVPAMAAGDVAGAVEQTWTDASSQIKTVVDMWIRARPYMENPLFAETPMFPKVLL